MNDITKIETQTATPHESELLEEALTMLQNQYNDPKTDPEVCGQIRSVLYAMNTAIEHNCFGELSGKVYEFEVENEHFDAI